MTEKEQLCFFDEQTWSHLPKLNFKLIESVNNWRVRFLKILDAFVDGNIDAFTQRLYQLM